MLDSVSWTLTIIIGVGLAIFAIAMLIDGVFDFIDFPVAHALGLFLAGSAATTLLFRSFGVVDLILAGAIGASVGVALVIVLVKLIAFARSSEHSGRIINFDTLVGSEVSIVWWDGDRGDVLVEISGQRLKVPAEANELISKDARMIIAGFDRVGDSLTKVVVEATSLKE